ncbi:uncharacterized protein BO97DRAFT_470459 [Aspergillus homomorphus CBS 101889]|uniref:Rhodopsin domain-containing protein n=1 Tax=Aspergillus homomorphus (strain CBS 101889) TaxID=1450537 RepID=A0A395I142_ASPHC|nr:hypothetical protein BO97DRAFT_470459 [Aspergillus homomorphus CBS 101889]RAL12254.1 hypothetical protein BO97DRAFT_470459 [Aspergillus homomorphus CBS 101889]
MYAVPIAITFLSLVCLVVALRLYTRLHMVRTPGMDDLLIVGALAADIVFFAFLIVEVQNGLAEKKAQLSEDVVRKQLKALYITIPLYNLSLTLTKLSLIFLYKRLFPTKSYQIILAITLCFVVATGLWMVFSAILFCNPIRSFWDTSLPHTCLPETVVWSLNAAFQISTDLLLVILPMPVLAKLQIPKRQKVALILIFALGFFVCATSIIRLTTIVHLVRSPDFTEGNGLAATWSFIECNVAIICACLPPLRPFIIRFFPHLMPSRARSYHPHPPREKLSRPSRTPAGGGGSSSSNAVLSSSQNPFAPASASYVTSVAGTFSMDSLCLGLGDSGQSHPHSHHQRHLEAEADGIQVVQELRWDSFAVAEGGQGVGVAV